MREYIKKPTEFGSVTPSSDELAKAMLEGLDLHNARTVLEYGPGNGIITDHIRQRISPQTQLAAIEINPRMHAALSKMAVQGAAVAILFEQRAKIAKIAAKTFRRN